MLPKYRVHIWLKLFAGTYLIKTITTKFPLVPLIIHNFKTNYADDGIVWFDLDPKMFHLFLWAANICLFVHYTSSFFILFTLLRHKSSCLSLLVWGQHSSFCQVLCPSFPLLFILFTFLRQSGKWLIFQDGNSYRGVFFFRSLENNLCGK